MHLFIKLLPLVNVIMDILMSCFIPLHDKYFFLLKEINNLNGGGGEMQGIYTIAKVQSVTVSKLR